MIRSELTDSPRRSFLEITASVNVQPVQVIVAAGEQRPVELRVDVYGVINGKVKVESCGNRIHFGEVDYEGELTAFGESTVPATIIGPAVPGAALAELCVKISVRKDSEDGFFHIPELFTVFVAVFTPLSITPEIRRIMTESRLAVQTVRREHEIRSHTIHGNLQWMEEQLLKITDNVRELRRNAQTLDDRADSTISDLLMECEEQVGLGQKALDILQNP